MRGDAADSQPVREGVRVPGCDPGDVCGVSGLLRIERLPRVTPRRPGRRERARHDDLCRRERELPLRESVRCDVAGGVEEGVRLVDAVVDDPDLDPGTRVGERGAGDVTGTDRGRIRAGQHPIGRRAVDVTYARKAAETVDVRGRQDDRDAVRDEPVAPAHRRVRDRRMERGREAALLGVDSPAGAVTVCARERRRSELNDDLGPRAGGRGRVRRADDRAEPDGCGEDDEGGERARHR